MDHGRVPVAVLGDDGLADGLIDVGHAHDRQKGHHLLLAHEDVVGVGLANEHAQRRVEPQADALAQHRGVAPH